MTTSLPAPRPRRTFPEISAVSWEHPADRAALQALRAVPGVDEVIRKVLALLGGERGVRLLFQGNAVRIGPTQFPKLWHLHTEVDHDLRLARSPRALRLPDAVLQRRRVRHRQAVHRHPLGRDRAAGRRRAAGARRARAGPRDERPRALSHHRGDPRADQPGRAADARGSRGAAGAARLPRVVPQVRALGRPRRPARRPGRRRGAAARHEDGRRRPGRRLRRAAQRGRLHAAGPRVRGHRRGARRGLQGAEHARAHPSDAHRSRRRAAALGRRGRVRPDPARRVRAARHRRPPSGRCATTSPPPATTTPARRASWPLRWPMPPSAPRSGPARRSGTRRSREAARRRRGGPGARALLDAPAGEPGRRHLLRAGQPRHGRAGAPTSRSRPTTSTVSPMPPTCTASTSPSSAPRCRSPAAWPTGFERKGAPCSDPAPRPRSSRRRRPSPRRSWRAAGIPTASSRTFQELAAALRVRRPARRSRWW